MTPSAAARATGPVLGRTLAPSELARVVGAELRRLRLRSRLSQGEVAQRLRLPRTVVSRRERGKHMMLVEHADEHARACDGSFAHVLLSIDLASGALPSGGNHA